MAYYYSCHCYNYYYYSVMLLWQHMNDCPKANLMHKNDCRQLAAVKKLYINNVQLLQPANQRLINYLTPEARYETPQCHFCYYQTHTLFFVTVQRHASTVYSIVVHLSQVNVHHHTTTILRPFFRDHPGEPVPEQNFWTL